MIEVGKRKMTDENGKKQQKFACWRTQRGEERSKGDAIPAVGRARGEECNGMLHTNCIVLLIEESDSEEEKIVAAGEG